MRSEDLYALVLKIMAISLLVRAIASFAQLVVLLVGGMAYAMQIASASITVGIFLGSGTALVLGAQRVARWLSQSGSETFTLTFNLSQLESAAFLMLGIYLMVTGLSSLVGEVTQICLYKSMAASVMPLTWGKTATAGFKTLLGALLAAHKQVNRLISSGLSWLRQTRGR
jgi:hypothetical protein